MKIIISHDVDHFTAWEHKNDLIIPKLFTRSLIEWCAGYINASEIFSRFKRIILKNKYHNIEEIMTFNSDNRVPSTFFIGVSSGNGLKYSLENAKFWTRKILNAGFEVGVHGISYDCLAYIKKEHELFKSIVDSESFGIRMHNLKQNNSTFELLEKANYIYDCTRMEMADPFKIGKLWEFPLHLMDIHVLCKNSRWQNQTLKESQETTKIILEKGYAKGLKYFSILYHDRFFSDDFKTWKEWYIWLVRYLKDNKFQFSNYKDAINDLANNSESCNHVNEH